MINLINDKGPCLGGVFAHAAVANWKSNTVKLMFNARFNGDEYSGEERARLTH